MNGFYFPFLFGYSKDRFLLRATCTTTNAHGEETPRHGAFFHLEIPSVIISGASRASGRRRGGRSKKQKRQQGGEVVCFTWLLLTDYLSFFFFFLLFFDYSFFFSFNILTSFDGCLFPTAVDIHIAKHNNTDAFPPPSYQRRTSDSQMISFAITRASWFQKGILFLWYLVDGVVIVCGFLNPSRIQNVGHRFVRFADASGLS